jgi:hypothetical protein
MFTNALQCASVLQTMLARPRAVGHRVGSGGFVWSYGGFRGYIVVMPVGEEGLIAAFMGGK